MEQVRVADVEATREALGWAPKMSLRNGLAATMEWFASAEADGVGPSDGVGAAPGETGG